MSNIVETLNSLFKECVLSGGRRHAGTHNGMSIQGSCPYDREAFHTSSITSLEFCFDLPTPVPLLGAKTKVAYNDLDKEALQVNSRYKEDVSSA